MMLYARSCDRLSNRSASVFLPLSIEFVFLLDRHPGKLEPPLLDLLVQLRLLALELRELLPLACHSSRVATLSSSIFPSSSCPWALPVGGMERGRNDRPTKRFEE